jgi:hypothetical protein
VTAAPVAPAAAPPLATGAGAATRRRFGLAGDLRIHLFGAIFALGTLHHELQVILVQQTTGPFSEYMERLGQVHPSIGWPSSVGIALHAANLLIGVLILVLPWRRELLGLLTIPFLLSNLTIPMGIASHNTLMAGALALVLMLGLGEIVERAGRGGQADGPGTDWYGWTLVGLTGLCALTYAFAAFHKLNPTWFSTTQGPGVDFILATIRPLGIPRPWALALLAHPVVYGVVAIEATLPLLLIYRRTRIFGCLLGILFHLPMMAAGVMDFPTVILAFYPLFLSLEQARELLARCLARPSAWRLAGTLVLGGIGAGGIRHAEQPNSYYVGSLGLEPLVMVAHSALLYLTFFFFAYVACTLAGWPVERRAKRAPLRVPA